METACVGSVLVMLSADGLLSVQPSRLRQKSIKGYYSRHYLQLAHEKCPLGWGFVHALREMGKHTEPDAGQQKSPVAFHVKTTRSKMSGPLRC